jgi:hypothetical protein
MKLKKTLTNLIYLLIISSYLFDSYHKLTQLPYEVDRLRQQYSNLFTLIKNTTGYQLPFDTSDVVSNGKYIIGGFAIA